jgi:hypothetical protein
MIKGFSPSWSRWLKLMATLVLFVGMSAPAAAAEQRIALVIGNSSYTDIAALKNPVSDARLMRTTLRGLGFEVIYRENATKADLEKAVSQFGQRLSQVGKQSVALFYYAGHGIQSGGENFLLPIGAPIVREADLRVHAVRAEDVLAQMESSQSGAKIVILDACRDNPFKVRFRITGGDGLADISLGNAEFTMAYAATAGNSAEDGDGANSPYAAALARRLATPDTEIFDMLRLVRIDVSQATGGRQLPEVRSTMQQEFYFNRKAGAPAQQVAVAAPSAPAATRVPTTPGPTAAVAARPPEILGKWCQATRGAAAFSLGISQASLEYSLQGQKLRYGVRSIQSPSPGVVELRWLRRDIPVLFEFGQFSADGRSMTQLRGREADGDWKSYNTRFQRC